MPGFICTLHGNTFMSVVCPHIEQGIMSGPLPATIIRMVVDHGYLLGDPEITLLFPHLYCPACAEQYGYPSGDTRITGDEFESLPEMQLIPVCSDCFREVRDREGRTIGVISGGEA
jgi:hypothetical protein